MDSELPPRDEPGNERYSTLLVLAIGEALKHEEPDHMTALMLILKEVDPDAADAIFKMMMDRHFEILEEQFKDLS